MVENRYNVEKIIAIQQGFEFRKFQSERVCNEFDKYSEKAYFLKKAIDIVLDNIANDAFDVPEFCREIAMARATLHRKVKAFTNMSTTEFIRSIKLKKAAEMLQQKDMRIEEVAFTVGFNTVSYFNKCFKKQFGVTPTKYI